MSSKFVNGVADEGFGARVYVQGFPGGTLLGETPKIVLGVGLITGGLKYSVELDAASAHTLSEFIREEFERVARSREEED